MNKHRTMIELIDKEDAISACNAQVWEGEALADIKNCIKPVLTIPENPTNGDMIKAIFPNCKLKVLTDKKEVVALELKDVKEWWNAPYKAESEDKE